MLIKFLLTIVFAELRRIKYQPRTVEIQMKRQLKTQMYLKLSNEHFLLAFISAVSVYHITVHLLSSKVLGLDQKKAKNI